VGVGGDVNSDYFLLVKVRFSEYSGGNLVLVFAFLTLASEAIAHVLKLEISNMMLGECRVLIWSVWRLWFVCERYVSEYIPKPSLKAPVQKRTSLCAFPPPPPPEPKCTRSKDIAHVRCTSFVF
jgi:hypothetical protein